MGEVTGKTLNAHQMLKVVKTCMLSKITTICQTGSAQMVNQCAKCQMISIAHQMTQIVKIGDTGAAQLVKKNAIHQKNGVQCQVTGNVAAIHQLIQIACVKTHMITMTWMIQMAVEMTPTMPLVLIATYAIQTQIASTNKHAMI